MSRAAEHRVRPRRPPPFSRPHIASLLLFVSVLSLLAMSTLSRPVDAGPLPDLAQEYRSLVSESSTDNSTDDSTDNSTEIAANTDVYVIKAVVYEIGILTDTDNTTSESTERQERIDISLYNPPYTEDEFS